MKYLLTLLCLCCLFTVARAQETSTDNEEPQYSNLSADSLSVDVGLIPESLDADVDSFVRGMFNISPRETNIAMTMMLMYISLTLSIGNVWKDCRALFLYLIIR